MTLVPALPERRLATPPEGVRHIGILNDYVRIPFANGSSFASQFLFRELGARGLDVTVVGPEDPEATQADLPERSVLLSALPLRTHPGVHLAMPTPEGLRKVAAQNFDLVLAQTCNALMDVGVWLRTTQRVPLMMVNTVHLPSVYNTLLSERLDRSAAVHWAFREVLVPFAEGQTVDAYNRGDGLVVLSKGLESYWRQRGVEVPIHVIGRAVDPHVFNRTPGSDPFPAGAKRGGRLLVVCRHVREKGIARLLRIFAHRIAPAKPNATLTLVGDGPDHDTFKALAEELRIADRVFFVGEQPLLTMSTWYAHADLFVYTSLSETYGQVVTEALWCGLPAVAFEDGMGVSGQIAHGHDGELIAPGPDEAVADAAFGHAVLRLLSDPRRRQRFGGEAARRAHLRADPERCIARYFEAFEVARDHCRRSPLTSRRDELTVLGRWAGVHSAAAALGLLRPPTHVPTNVSVPSWG